MVFLVHFQLRCLSEAAAEHLMQFFNALLEFFEAACRLPIKLATLRKQPSFGSATKGVRRYIVCPLYHKNYDEQSLPLDRVADPVEQILRSHKEFLAMSPHAIIACSSARPATNTFQSRCMPTVLWSIGFVRCSTVPILSAKSIIGDLVPRMLESCMIYMIPRCGTR